MTTERTMHPHHVARDHTRLTGLLCLSAGFLGAVSGIFLAVVPPAVDSDRYSYPLTATAFALIQGWFFVQHLGLIAGLEGLRRAGAVGAHRLGILAANGGMAMLAMIELLAISAATSTYSGPRTDLLGAGYGIASTVIGIGLIVAGLAVPRVQVWTGWRRWLLLIMGVYVFVPMFPAMFGGFVAARLAITGWMLLFVLLGWVMVRDTQEASGEHVRLT